MMALAIAACTFTSCEDVPEPYNNPWNLIGGGDDTPVVVDPAGSGTVEDPYNVAMALQVCQEVGEGGTTENVYARGIITSITDLSVYNPETSQGYGNATFLIADNNSGSTLTVYRAYSLNNEKFTKNDEIAEGDTVVICGKLVNYKGNTPEFTQGCYVYSIKKGQGGGETPTTPGTAEKPLTVAEALAYTTALAADKQSPVGFVKGKICSIKEVDTGQYGNATYSISDDGTENNALQIYRGYSVNGEKFKSANEIKVGDEVIITGKLVNYKGNTPQFAQGSSIYKLNNGGGGNTGDAVGTKDAPKTVAEALAAVDALANGATTEQFWYVKGKVKQVITAADKISQYKNIDYLITDDGNNEIKVFRGKNLDNSDFTSADQLQVGDEVVVYGQLMKYEDTKNSKIVPEIAQGNYLVKRTANGNGGGNGGGGNGGGEATSLTNGNFETWAEGQPTGWKSASTASSATLEQSTDAHGGSYSVKVKGNESKNVRLASQEITLAAGTYTFSFWVKATTTDVSQARPGFVPVVNGTADSKSYTYGDYATLSTNWKQVSYEFTLTAETTVCLLVMNPKKSSNSSGKDILVDDATLTKK